MNWEPHAARLAAEVTHPASRWRPVVAGIPRHAFVPRWWDWAPGGPGFYHELWEPRDGTAEPAEWAAAAYRDRSLVTQVGALHADITGPDSRVIGLPTSSATMPSLLIQMFRHAMIGDGMDVLDVGTGSGYGCALLSRRLGDRHVTSVDIDEYLTKTATQRMGSIGLHPTVTTCDATGPLPGTYDRIVSTVSVRPVPAGWLTALRPGGRLVTAIAGTGLIVTADKTLDGGAAGRIEPDRAGFMPTRTGPDYPGGLLERFAAIRDADGEQAGTGRYPVVHVGKAWELYSMLGVTVPGVDHHYEEHGDGRRTVWLLHPDGSWARATGTPDGLPAVHQSGPQNLWDIVDDIRHAWLRDGSLPAYGADASIGPDGIIRLNRGRWDAVIA